MAAKPYEPRTAQFPHRTSKAAGTLKHGGRWHRPRLNTNSVWGFCRPRLSRTALGPPKTNPSCTYDQRQAESVRTHLQPLNEMAGAYSEGQLPIEEVAQRGVAMYEHINQTMSIAVVPEAEIPELASIKQNVQQVGEIIENGIKAIQNAERKAQEQAAQQQAQQQPQQPQMEMKDQISIEQLNFEKLKFEREMAFREQELNQKQIENQQKHVEAMRKLELDKADKTFPIKDTPAERVDE